MAPLEASSEKDKVELELRPFDRNGMSPQECPESPGTEDDAVQAHPALGKVVNMMETTHPNKGSGGSAADG